MKKLVYIFASLLMLASLSSCNGKIENPSVKNLIGTWDLVSDTIISGNTEATTVAKGGEYIVITETTFSSCSGDREVKSPFSFSDPHLYIDGMNTYDLVSLTRNEMVIKTNSALYSLFGGEHRYNYKRRTK